jgi:tryptophanyl-tRNA synthetase
MPEEFVVTPWEVKGKIDYEKLIKKFGTKQIDDELLERIKKHTKDLHFMLRRGIFFSHRDLDFILDKYENGEKFFLYTGRGPSGKTHLGHLIPWIFTKWLQDKFDAELYFQITEDEKSLINRNLSLEETVNLAYDNILDVIAVGFDPKKTHIFLNTEYSKTLYKIAIKIAKHITFSTAKAIFGFENSSNIGIIFFPSMQIAPCFLPSVLEGRNIPCLIPASIDQDDYWRPARDVAVKLGFYKPAQIHCKLLPSLQGPDTKMSSSQPNTAIFTTDTPEEVRKKIMNAFTGQQPTAELQRKLGGNPEICSVCQYYFYLFEEDDKKVQEIFESERNGTLLAGEHKEDLAEKAVKFIEDFQKKREKAKDQIEKFMLRD